MKKWTVLLCFLTMLVAGGCSATNSGAAETGRYRNLFAEIGKSQPEIDKKVDEAFQSLFHGDKDATVYYEFNENEAYIKDINNTDIRTEGMSYGMMICVQLDKKVEFDKLWRFAQNRMQYKEGKFAGYFNWHVTDKGEAFLDDTPASDGEEYFVTALLFADKRWGSDKGSDYLGEAKKILHAMIHKPDAYPDGYNLFDTKHAMVRFIPEEDFSDPSYHLPAFYEVWAKKAPDDSAFWLKAADVSRKYFKAVSHPQTGLVPDYATFDGQPVKDHGHEFFQYDAFRTVQNAAMDYAWWEKDQFEAEYADRVQAFFESKGLTNYPSCWALDGSSALQPYHATALVAMNAVASLAAKDKERREKFVAELWDLTPPRGQYRYYDGMLYMLGLLHCSGNFKAYL